MVNKTLEHFWIDLSKFVYSILKIDGLIVSNRIEAFAYKYWQLVGALD